MFEEPVAGTVGVKVMSSVFEVPRLPKYSTESGIALPAAPASVDVAGRFTPMLIAVVGSPAVWFALITTGCSPAIVSRGKTGIEPSEFAGQPRRTRPDSVRRMPSASGRKAPVVVIIRGCDPPEREFSETALVTGSIPRPAMARSSAWLVATSAPCSSTSRVVAARTPPAEYVPAPRAWLMTKFSKSVEARLYP